MGGSLSLGWVRSWEKHLGGQGPGLSSLLSAEAVPEPAWLRLNASLDGCQTAPTLRSAPALRGSVSRLWPSCPSPSFLCGAPFSVRTGLLELEVGTAFHQGLSRQARGGGTRGHSEGHGGCPLQAPGSCLPCSLPSLASPCLRGWAAAYDECWAPAVSSPSAARLGWRPVGIRAGRAPSTLGASLHLCKADLEERLGALWGGQRAAGTSSGPSCLPRESALPLGKSTSSVVSSPTVSSLEHSLTTVKCASSLP